MTPVQLDEKVGGEGRVSYSLRTPVILSANSETKRTYPGTAARLFHASCPQPWQLVHHADLITDRGNEHRGE